MAERNRDILGQLQKALKDKATRDPFLAAIADFVKAVEYSGGITPDSSGLYQQGVYAIFPSQSRVAFGEVYFALCEAIGRDPLVRLASGASPEPPDGLTPEARE